jgi:hypothetical protein
VPQSSIHVTSARRALLGAALLGVVADPLLRNGPWGFGLLLWMAAFAIIVVTVVSRSGNALSRESRVWLGVAVLFSAGLSWHDSGMLQFFDVVAMLTALTLLAMSMNGIPAAGLAIARVRDLIRAALGTGFDVAFGTIPLVLSTAERDAGVHVSNTGNASRIAKALVITAPVILVFTALFMRADPVFDSYLKLPDINFTELVSHAVVAGFFAWVVAGWLRRSLFPSPGADGALLDSFPLTLGAVDVTIALGALNVLFAAFVAVQIGWLFGGETLIIKTTGLTYAEYARRGFFELTCVAALLLPTLLGAHALIPDSDARTHRLYRRLALPLIVLLGAVMASAGARMKLYVHYYGISTDRLYATAFMLWLAIVFVWLAVTVLRSRPRTFAIGLVTSGFATLLTLNVLNPDELVARSNLARGDVGRSGATGADYRYVATLGGGAMPLLVSALTASNVGVDTAGPHDRCDAARILLKRWTGEHRAETARNWFQWNLERMQATREVRAHETRLRQLACPATPGHG